MNQRETPGWEYLIVPIHTGLRDSQDELNALGRDGWEVVSVYGNGAIWACLKRPRVEAA